MIVMKFGGTSVKDADAMLRVQKIASTKDKAILVCSAMSGITDLLTDITYKLKNGHTSPAYSIVEEIHRRHIKTAKALHCGDYVIQRIDSLCGNLKQIIYSLDIIGEISPKSMDLILSFGEKLSSHILYGLISKKKKAHYIEPEDLIITDNNFNEANVLFDITAHMVSQKCKTALRDYDIIITGGFLGMTVEGQVTTLGRGGSDYSASIIASAMNAEKLEIWTDVCGIMTADPNIIEDARVIKELSYTEASELAFFGAKVLHPRTILPAVENNIPVYVLNTFAPERKGTLILPQSDDIKDLKAIAFRKDVTVINIHSLRMLGTYGFLKKVFDVFDRHMTAVDLVTTSEVNISLTIDNKEKAEEIIQELKEFAEVEAFGNKAIISAVGEGIRNTAGIGARFFGALKGINVSMVSLGASEVNLSVIVDSEELIPAIRKLHNEFFAAKPDTEIFEEL